jgi:hypothetical protein
MDDMDSGQQAREGMMSAAVSFLRYFLLKIAYADYFYELCPVFMGINLFCVLRIIGVFSAGNTAISPAGGASRRKS